MEPEVIEPVKPEPLPEEEKMDRAIAAARERIRPISREHSRPSPTSTLRYSGQSVPSQTHGRPMGSFTGPGMRKLRRHKATRVHEKQMGVDHSLSMDDIEPKRRRRRH